MRLRNIKNGNEILKMCPNYINNPENFKGHYHDVFENNNPIVIEIGMGKGTFIINMAKKYPHVNFIGIEKYTSVICRAAKKIDEKIDNLRIINYDAILLQDIFEKEIDTIYLTFSDPWPKDRHEKRRLTSKNFLSVYDSLFEGQNKIILKTDNDDFYNYSLDSLRNNGYEINKDIRDLASSEIDNIKTEYEEKFSSLGKNINYLEATKDNHFTKNE